MCCVLLCQFVVSERGSRVAMSSCTMKVPPKFVEGSPYESWKKDVNLWTKLTELDGKKQGIAVYLSLTGQAKNVASEIPEDELCKPTGVATVLAKLDTLFLADKSLRQFSAFNKLYNLRRSENMPISTFISEFEHVYFDFKRHDMTLPESVQAFVLLSACSLSEQERKVVMSGITDLTYVAMKEALRRIFATELNSKKSIDIKNEPVFHSFEDSVEQEAFYANKSRGSWRGNRGGRGRGRGKFFQPGTADARASTRQFKPADQTEKIRRCFGCGSKYHWIKECPEVNKHDNNSKHTYFKYDDSETVHLSLFNGSSEVSQKRDKLKTLISEADGHVVLDTGCSSTVCGTDWYENYVKSLSEYDKNMIKEIPSSSTFTFGDGVIKKSIKKVSLPCYLDGKRSTITTDLVDCQIPLLLSKNSMKKAQMQLCFSNDTVYIGKSLIKLKCSTSGHYLLPINF